MLSLAGSPFRQGVVLHSRVCMAEGHLVVEELSSASDVLKKYHLWLSFIFFVQYGLLKSCNY